MDACPWVKNGLAYTTVDSFKITCSTCHEIEYIQKVRNATVDHVCKYKTNKQETRYPYKTISHEVTENKVFNINSFDRQVGLAKFTSLNIDVWNLQVRNKLYKSFTVDQLFKFIANFQLGKFMKFGILVDLIGRNVVKNGIGLEKEPSRLKVQITRSVA